MERLAKVVRRTLRPAPPEIPGSLFDGAGASGRPWTNANAGPAAGRGEKAVKSIAVVGASGAVGDVMIRLLQERKFPVGTIKFLASERSAGKTLSFAGATYTIEPLVAEAFNGVDIVLSSTPAAVSREFSPIAARAGAVVVDNSSAFRMDPDVPLVVPEVNPHDVAGAPTRVSSPTPTARRSRWSWR